MISLAGCGDQGGDPTAQIGPKPNLPELQQFLIPQMHVAKIVGWKQDEKPAVAQGLKIEALATGLQHPRSVCVLPNGDVLVVESKAAGTEPVTRPKSIVMHWVEWMATSGGNTGESKPSRITLLRDTNVDGVPKVRSLCSSTT
jgi:glucose/arabinose dehydrogenase